MRKALIVGIDWYEHLTPLNSCVQDALSVHEVLERHADGSVNFPTPLLIAASSRKNNVDRAKLREAVAELFSTDAEIALFYFAGHGYIEATGGYLCASDSRTGDDGLSLADIMSFVNRSRARNKVIILDSCFAGIAGNRVDAPATAEINEGTTLLTASTADQAAMEDGGSGVFTELLVDALSGSAANLVGDVTPGSVYAHIDQSLGPWDQRPVFKTNVKAFVSLRKATPPISVEDLRALSQHFPSPGYKLKLDPSFEPERGPYPGDLPPPNAQNTAIFSVLQRYAKVNLVRPVDADHMWNAAMENKVCELTVVGEHYRRLVSEGLI